MKKEYEIISHSNNSFHIFLVNLLCRSPHFHKDYEIGVVLNGNVTITTNTSSYKVEKNDFFVMNPFQSHELSATSPALILSLQIHPSFFLPFFQQIQNISFTTNFFSDKINKNYCSSVKKHLVNMAFSFFKKEEFFELKCGIEITQLFYFLMKNIPYEILSDKIVETSQSKGTRMREIISYIDDHYSEKLLLADICDKLGLNLYYMSHYFKDCFGISFQEYLLKIRCEHARHLLLTTKYSLLEISISCGFSDPKYFNKGFQKQYGCTPKQYRYEFKTNRLCEQQKALLTTQEFLSPSSSLFTLERYLD